MDAEVPRPAEPAVPVEPPPPLPALPDAVVAGDDELRRLIDAGASTPEELRALAARIREHRELEESLWRRDVKPQLLKAKKRRFTLRDLGNGPAAAPADDAATNNLKLGLTLLGVVAVFLLLAASSSPLWILAPVAAVLVYAYLQGRQPDPPPAAEDPPAGGVDTLGP